MTIDNHPTAKGEDAPLLETVGPLTFGTENASQSKSAVQSRKKGSQTHFPDAKWTRALKTEDRLSKRKTFPQVIAHRGYKAKFPENSMSAFRGAVEAGAHALETDIHLSRDGVVVLSHDPTLKRCFGEKKRIIDCDWEYLSTVRTTNAPHEKMPRLVDLLRYLSDPEREDVWVLLDIKVDNNPEDVMRLIAEAISSVPPGKKPWNERIVLGCWAGTYLPLSATHLPTFPITIISFSITYSEQFLRIPNISFNTFQKILMGPLAGGFLPRVKATSPAAAPAAQAHGSRPLFTWTVNNPLLMKWCVRNGVDGVISDDPAGFRQICEEWGDEDEVDREIGVLLRLQLYWLAFVVLCLGPVFRRRFPVNGVEGFVVDSPPSPRREKRKAWVVVE